jgi:hypothetical protein
MSDTERQEAVTLMVPPCSKSLSNVHSRSCRRRNLMDEDGAQKGRIVQTSKGKTYFDGRVVSQLMQAIGAGIASKQPTVLSLCCRQYGDV